MATIYPSLFAASPLCLEEEIKKINDHCQGYHIDVMDGHFVPNITWGPHVINAISSITSRTLWIQLMVTDPIDWIERLALPPRSLISVHIESSGEVRHLIKRIHEKGWHSSVSINPETSVESIFPVLDDVHHVLVMSVEPGFSGQNFLPKTIEKIDTLAGYRQTSGLNFDIGIDGGISIDNISLLAEKGVNDFAVGSALFNAPDQIKALKEFNALANNPTNVDCTKYHTQKNSKVKK